MQIETLLEKCQQVRLLVVGDVMLDRYWFGEVNRISPEAPVPIVKIEREEERLGGAANVARNIAAFGCQTDLLSVIGDDEPGRILTNILEKSGIRARVLVDASIRTIVKLRIIGRQQQLLRADFETPPSHEVLRDKLGDYYTLILNNDAVVLSDYGKGGLTHICEMISCARDNQRPIFIDPKGDDYSKYANATVLTPNRQELRQVVGSWRDEAELTEKAQKLRQQLNLQALLLTRSEEGMTLYLDNQVLHQSAMAREVFDVSGAGDTVIATIATMYSCGLDLSTAVYYANLAAGIVVGKLGTAVITKSEMIAAAQ